MEDTPSSSQCYSVTPKSFDRTLFADLQNVLLKIFGEKNPSILFMTERSFYAFQFFFFFAVHPATRHLLMDKALWFNGQKAITATTTTEEKATISEKIDIVKKLATKATVQAPPPSSVASTPYEIRRNGTQIVSLIKNRVTHHSAWITLSLTGRGNEKWSFMTRYCNAVFLRGSASHVIDVESFRDFFETSDFVKLYALTEEQINEMQLFLNDYKNAIEPYDVLEKRERFDSFLLNVYALYKSVYEPTSVLPMVESGETTRSAMKKRKKAYNFVTLWPEIPVAIQIVFFHTFFN